MAKIFEMQSFRRRNKTQASSTYDPSSPEFRQLRGDFFRPIHAQKKRVSRPGSSLRASFSAGARLLPVIALLWALYLTGLARKSSDANPKQDLEVKTAATPQPFQPSPTVSKPLPIVPVDTAPVKNSFAPKQTPPVAHSPESRVPRSLAMQYQATRKKVFGGCTGQLELTNATLQFRCPDQTDLIFPVAAIAKAHKDGVVLKSGEKYHFTIANQTRGQAEAIFVSWLNRVQQTPRPSRASLSSPTIAPHL